MMVQVGVRQYLLSSIGSKQVMALTGLGLGLFVLGHMAGNLLLFVGPDAYNSYSHILIKSPLILLVEFGLAALFVVHIAVAVRLSRGNSASRPVAYQVRGTGDKGTCFRQRTLLQQGGVLAVFIFHHLITVKFGPHYDTQVGGVVMRDVYRLVIEIFKNPAYVAWYFFVLIVLGFHLSHGMTSIFQTLGIHHPKFQLMFKFFGIGFAALVTIGFLVQPGFVFFFHH